MLWVIQETVTGTVVMVKSMAVGVANGKATMQEDNKVSLRRRRAEYRRGRKEKAACSSSFRTWYIYYGLECPLILYFWDTIFLFWPSLYVI